MFVYTPSPPSGKDSDHVELVLIQMTSFKRNYLVNDTSSKGSHIPGTSGLEVAVYDGLGYFYSDCDCSP